MKRFLAFLLPVLLILTACGQATPTPSVQNTSIPAPTQAATATPLPSTATPQIENTTPAETQIASAVQTLEATSAAQTQEATTPEETQIASAPQTQEATTASQTLEATSEQTLEATAESTASATTEFAADAKTPTQLCAAAVPAADPANRQFTQAAQVLQPNVDYRAVFCTDVGPIYVDLFEKYAPVTVNNFVFLAQQDYYNNTTFHRVIQGFMAQGGDPTASGTGGPGYQFKDEIVGFLNFNQPGQLAMANAGPNTNGSQFFITTAPATHLNYDPSTGTEYTIFGEVLEGQNNANNISVRDPDTATQPGTKLNTVIIVTDPSTVKTTYTPPASATRADIQKVIDTVDAQIPAVLALDKEHTGIFETAQVAQTAPDAMRAAYAAFLAKYHHEFRAEHQLNNAQCDTKTVPYDSISYTMDRFNTPEDAAAALNDGFMQQIETVSNFTAATIAGMDYPVYTKAQKACNADATDAVTFWLRGHYVITAEAIFPSNSNATADRWLRDLVGLTYEGIFGDVLRTEMR